MYRQVSKSPNLPAIEHRILDLWKETKAFEKLREKNKGGPRWSFLDGPITANNPMGVHHAWGRTLKDIYQRYHAMCGYELRYQNGFDCQGLWVEVEVEKEKGFQTKQDIEQYGISRFVEDCKERVRRFAKIQTEQSIRLGYWMDWDNSYYTMSDENNYTIWSFLKKCHQRGYIYQGADAMPWCPRCGVGLSQMELHEGYKWVEHLSVVVRFPIRGRNKEALLVWTTTPWTLTSNVACAVHPYMDYIKVRCGEWQYYVGRENFECERTIEVEEDYALGKKRRLVRLPTIKKHLSEFGDIEVVSECKGGEILGLEYDGPFDDLPAQHEMGGYPYKDENLSDRCGVTCHKVIPWDAVSGKEGTGIVHIAPGCGAEDFALGKEHRLVAISPLDEAGIYTSRFGWLSGKHAHDVAKEIIADLKKKNLLIGLENYPHRYAHCWRCHTPIVYRLVDEWYINMAWRGEIMSMVPKIKWIPEYGAQLEMDWLRNMGDWMISKKRYWGLALPIWRCDNYKADDPSKRCTWFTVIGGKEELRERAVVGWDKFEGKSPHRPWVDEVKIRCERCSGLASRIPEVGNPWLDAGIVPYSTVKYNTDREYFDKWIPADLVLECFPGQFRNWFYALLAMSTMMQEDKWADKGGTGPIPPFKTLVGYALVRDEEGREMHKSLGNAIDFNYAAERIGAETMRYIYASQNPLTNLNFPNISESRPKNKVHRDEEVMRELLTLWNCYSFYITYAEVDGITPDKLTTPINERSELDRWIIGKLQRLIQYAKDCYENYKVHLLMQKFESFVSDLSTWYLRRSRRRFWKSEEDNDKISAYSTLFDCLIGVCKVMAPILPFLTEEMYQNMVRSVDENAPVSIHLLDFPTFDASLIDQDLEGRIDAIVKYRNLGMRIRNECGIKVRQPLSKILIKPETMTEKNALLDQDLATQLCEELNVKQIEIIENEKDLVTKEVKPNLKSIGGKWGIHTKEIQKKISNTNADLIIRHLEDKGVFELDMVDGTKVSLKQEDIEVQEKPTKGISFVRDGSSFVALDTTITEELRFEGIARDFVRGVQDYRREMALNVADRIRLKVSADQETRKALQRFLSYICKETLTVEAEFHPTITDGKVIKVGSGTQVFVQITKL